MSTQNNAQNKTNDNFFFTDLFYSFFNSSNTCESKSVLQRVELLTIVCIDKKQIERDDSQKINQEISPTEKKKENIFSIGVSFSVTFFS